MSDYEEDEDDDYQDFREERGAVERTEKRHVFFDMENEPAKDARSQTPLEKFISNIRNVSDKILDNRHIDSRLFNKDDVNQIISNINLFSKPEYKNPTCFVFGYIATRRGSKIDYDTLIKLYKIIDKVDETKNIRNADIIRYCTLWINTV
jgi:hypothetical protein